jgi:hypothetical protein
MFVLRSKESYDATVSAIGSANHNTTETGIKRGCIFNQLKYFHVIGNYCVDRIHDLLEGVAPYEVSLVLQALTEDKFLALDDLNLAITFSTMVYPIAIVVRPCCRQYSQFLCLPQKCGVC